MENEFKFKETEKSIFDFDIEAFKASRGLDQPSDVPPKVVKPQVNPPKVDVSPEQSFFSLLKFLVIVFVICYVGFFLYYVKFSSDISENMQRTQIEHQQRYEMKRKLFEESGIY